MKKSAPSLVIGLLLTCNIGIAKTQHLTLEQRVALLEERLETAKMRAAKAERQIKQLQTQQATEIREIKTAQGNTPINGQSAARSEKKNATPPNLPLSGCGNLEIYDDVEFNMDAESNHGLLAMTNAGVNSDPTNEQWNLNGHILLSFDDMRKLGNGYFTGFPAQPLGGMYGSVNVDDAVFFFSKENGWGVKIGRFEAYDIFPLSQNTFVEHFGNTANDLYDDGSSYIYMMKEDRGRSNAGGNFLVSKQLDNQYLELNTLLEDGTFLYNDDNYHGRGMEQQRNVTYLRPVIAWSPTEEFTISAAMEADMVSNVYGYTGSKGNFIDQSDRTGYGMNTTQNGLKTDPENGTMVSLNTIYLDANNEKDFTTGVNALWKRFELGCIYAHNKIDEFSGVVCDNDCWVDGEGAYNVHTIHVSCQFASVMDTGNFNVYLGMYYSILDSDDDKIRGDSSNDRYDVRVRSKYSF